MTAEHIKERLEHLRQELRAERISYGEIVELQSLRQHIDPEDVELLEAAGVPESKRGLRCPQCNELIWDFAFASKLNKCWNCGLAFDSPEEDDTEESENL